MSTTTTADTDTVFGVPVTPAPIREAQPDRNVPAEPRSEESFRRFAYGERDGRFHIVELEPTHRFPMNWMDFASTREGAWKRAQAQRLPVVVDAAEAIELGVVYDQDVADELAYNSYCAAGASFSDAAFYVPLGFDAWKAAGRPRD
jgi:hypothetical protein